MNNEEGLTAFIYLLMRDALPSGKVARIAIEIEKCRIFKGELDYTSIGQRDYAKVLARRVLGSPDKESQDA